MKLYSHFNQTSYLVNFILVCAAVFAFSMSLAWLIGLESYILFFGFATMKFNTSISFLSISAGLYFALKKPGKTRFILLFSLLPILLSFGSFLAELDWIGSWVDNLFVPDQYTSTDTPFPAGRMSPATYTSFILLSTGLLLHRKMPGLSHFNSYLVILIAVLSISSHIIEVAPGDQPYFIATSAIPTSLLFLIFSLLLIYLNSHLGYGKLIFGDLPGSAVVRIFLPIMALALLLEGFVTTDLMRDQRLSVEFSIAISTFAGIFLLIVLGFITGTGINRTAAERLKLIKKLSSMNDALKQKNREVENFNFITSHDMREPLKTIESVTTLMQPLVHKAGDSHDKKLLSFLMEATRRADSLMNDISIYNQLQKIEVTGLIDPNRICQEVITELGSQIKVANAEITVERLPKIKVDEFHFKTLIRHLLENSIKFSREGHAASIIIESHSMKNEYLFSIIDNGIGISPKFHEIVFDVFKRLHLRTNLYPGNGIGLAVSRRIVSQFGGRIWIKSNPGEGVTVHFTVPMPGS